MEVTFNDRYLENLYIGKTSGKQRFGSDIVKRFIRVVNTIKNIENVGQLKMFNGLNFEALRGNKKGTYSVRVSKAYRLEFLIENDVLKMTEIVIVEKLSNHYK